MVLWFLWQANATEDPLSWLINLGVAGIVIVLLITGKLRTGKEVDHLLDEIEKKDEVIAAFQAQLTGHTLPAMARSAQVLEHLPTAERSVYAELRQMQTDIVDIANKLNSRLGELP